MVDDAVRVVVGAAAVGIAGTLSIGVDSAAVFARAVSERVALADELLAEGVAVAVRESVHDKVLNGQSRG